MKALPFLLVATLIFVSACTSAPLFPVNETPNASENTTPVSPVEPVDETPIDETPIDEPPVDETPVVRPPVDEQYAAEIEVVEGELVALDTRATDPDGDEVTLTFSTPLDEEGRWQTAVGDAGEYSVLVVASDGQLETEARVLIRVLRANSPPVIVGPDSITVFEGEEVDLSVFTITDPDGDAIVTSYSGWMRSSSYLTTYDDAGIHTVRIIAEDTAGNEAVHVLTVEVIDVNRRPVLTVQDRAITVIEGERAVIRASAEDPDGDDVTITFDAPFDELGAWQTAVGDAGDYRITVTASDGQDTVERTVLVSVQPSNRPPVITVERVITVREGETIDFDLLADIRDPEGDPVTVTYSGWMTGPRYTTTYDDSGEYVVTITASDGVSSTRVDVTVIVEDVNRPPVFIRPA